MPQATTTNLDAEELLHLALNASAQGKHEDAISSLKRAVTLAPKEGRIHYLLGAEHAQIGLYDRAVEEMARAVELDPSLDTARFQLGLLHITSGRVEPAEKAWKPLDNLGQEHPLRLFKTGLLHLARDEFAQCVELLKKGITLNRVNPALNNDMQRVVGDVEKHLQTAAATTKLADTKATTPSKHVLLSAYRQNREEDKDKE